MIKNVVLNQRCKILAKSKPKEHVSYQNAKRFGILYNAGEFEKRQVENLIGEFKADGKETSMLAYADKEIDEPLTFNKKDISSSGSVSNDKLNFFIKQNFDFLIALDTSGDIHFKYILALSKATCKVGINTNHYNELLVMTVKPSNGLSDGMKDIIKYLKMI